MTKSHVLLYMSSQSIMNFCTQNPIDWLSDYKKLAAIGGKGDQAGIPPSTVVGEFIACLINKKSLFTQYDFMVWCADAWSDWRSELNKYLWRGVVTKLYRNFYPSMIDSLYVWALLCETGKFSICYMDSIDDAISKSDITIFSNDNSKFHIALSIGTKKANDYCRYKTQNRHGTNVIETVRVELPMTRERSPGNKRWYCLEDFNLILSQTSGQAT